MPLLRTVAAPISAAPPYAVRAVFGIVVDDKLADLCVGRGPSEEVLQAAGVETARARDAGDRANARRSIVVVRASPRESVTMAENGTIK